MRQWRWCSENYIRLCELVDVVMEGETKEAMRSSNEHEAPVKGWAERGSIGECRILY